MTTTDINILIVEDELLIAEMLKEILQELGYKVIAIAKSYSIALEKLTTHSEINFAFVDLNLNEVKTGLDLATKINEVSQIPFIFLTSYSDSKTIQEAINTKPQSYLIKPFTKSDLLIALEIFKSKKVVLSQTIEIKDGQLNSKINHNDILWIKSENIYLEVKTSQKTYIIRKSLDRFLEKLNNGNFIRIHRSYVVNLKEINAINKQFVFINQQKIPISRNHYDKLIAKFSE